MGIEGGQRLIYCTAGVRRDLHNQFIAARNGKPPFSTKAFVCTVRKINHHDVVSSWIFADKLLDRGPQVWTKQAGKTLEEAPESDMVEVIVAASF